MRRPTLRVYLPLRGKRNRLLNSKGEDDALAAVLRIVENRQWPADGYHFFFGVWAPPVRGGEGSAREIDLVIVDEQADMLHFVEIKGGSRLYDGQTWHTYDGRDPYDQVDGAAAQFMEGLGAHLAGDGVGGRLAFRRFVWGPSQMRDEIKALLPREQARQFIGREHDPVRYIRKNVRLFPPPDGPLLAVGDHLERIVAFIDANASPGRGRLDGAAAVRDALEPTGSGGPAKENRAARNSCPSSKRCPSFHAAGRRWAVALVAMVVLLGVALWGYGGGFRWSAFGQYRASEQVVPDRQGLRAIPVAQPGGPVPFMHRSQ